MENSNLQKMIRRGNRIVTILYIAGPMRYYTHWWKRLAFCCGNLFIFLGDVLGSAMAFLRARHWIEKEWKWVGQKHVTGSLNLTLLDKFHAFRIQESTDKEISFPSQLIQSRLHQCKTKHNHSKTVIFLLHCWREMAIGVSYIVLCCEPISGCLLEGLPIKQ